MRRLNPSKTIDYLLSENPNRTQVLSRYGIAHPKDGSKTLLEACSERNLSLVEVMSVFELLERHRPLDHKPPALEASIDEWIDHIVKGHHEYLRKELKRLTVLLAKCAKTDGQKAAWWNGLKKSLADFRLNMEKHLDQEEERFFPIFRTLEYAHTAPSFHFGSIRHPLEENEKEHDSVRSWFRRFRRLIAHHNIAGPNGTAFRKFLKEIELLEWDLYRHIQEEDEVLFPKVLEREKHLAALKR